MQQQFSESQEWVILEQLNWLSQFEFDIQVVKQFLSHFEWGSPNILKISATEDASVDRAEQVPEKGEVDISGMFRNYTSPKINCGW